MAWITSFELKAGSGKLHPTQLVGAVKVFVPEPGKAIVQIDTYGSDEREMPNKQSQTIQFGRESAHQLFTILKETYEF
ncbi:hypothetical protein [Hyphomicrobium sulfonivorans]|uniref:hypothetical protein n=1 Tax=Hyphomicrobium sulfonivorans TaxID=121290 RepID=UPI00156D6D49|nr:hypothetical protein [Hyphomicrobium sulfonivorans]MBI1649460.1 hypothetical protein [Hyphomicrobium sulfonivorans]NSL71377.1 hypothetical protein [Hyphomicrobium sulfonivorans]